MRLGGLLFLLLLTAPSFGADRPKAPSVHRSSSTKKFSFDEKRLSPHEPEVYKYNRPEDLIELIPILRDINRWIPRRFSLADHQFTLQPSNVTVTHIYQTARSRSMKKDNIISFSYEGEMGGSMDTEVDVPLMYSTRLGLINWERYPMGNYTMRFNMKNSGSEDRVFLRARTKF